MKKTLKYITVAGAMSAMLLGACKDDVLVPVEDNNTADSVSTMITTEQGKMVTLNTELNTITISNKKLADSIQMLPQVYSTSKVQYTISVISAANAWWGSQVSRQAGVDGAIVTLTQNGASVNKTTENGLVVFSGLNPGTVSVSISATDHTSIDFTAWLGIGEQNGDIRNAGSQIFLFPNGATNGGMISGKAYANRSTINDTLGRVNMVGQNTNPAGANYNANKGKYTADYNNFDIYNYTQYNIGYSGNNRGLYANKAGTSTSGREISWELGPEGMKVYAYPSLRNISMLPNNLPGSEPGYITEWTYKDIVKSGTIDATGSFMITGIPCSNFKGYLYSNNVEFTTASFSADHKRFTGSLGTKLENGSTPEDFKAWDVNTGIITDVSYRTISQKHAYVPSFVHSTNIKENSDYNFNMKFVSNPIVLTPGDTKTLHILYFPLVEQL